MKPRLLIEPADARTIFDRAVQEHSLAVLTLQDGPEWLSFKSRFLERDARGRSFVLDYQAVDDVQLPILDPGQCIGVSFRQRSHKVLFATVVEAHGHFALDDQTSVPAVRYRWPETMTELQRRAYYRTPVPEDTSLIASLWPGGVAARARAQGGQVDIVTGYLQDLSCGGTLVRLHTNTHPSWRENQTVGLEMQLPDGRPPISLDAHYRGTRPDEDGNLSAALQFVGLELTVDGRLVLERLATSLQRLHRLTSAGGRHQRDQHRGHNL